MRKELDRLLDAMSAAQLVVIYKAAVAISTPLVISVNPASDFADASFAESIGLKLLMHHTVSSEPFTKDKFEHAMARTLTEMGKEAALARRGNRGHDITVERERWSLKTQADASIKPSAIHISKFMELGKGKWDSESDLTGLRQQMLDHIEGYDRIFTLRCLSAARSWSDRNAFQYELIEIPKRLLATDGEFGMMHDSLQHPKPGYCRVRDDEGELLFELYFDAGTERKLQVRKLRTDACVTHCTWSFRIEDEQSG